ncbi:MAG: HAMP domain-containing sensor histidine kinase [Chloroflexota bacterium]
MWRSYRTRVLAAMLFVMLFALVLFTTLTLTQFNNYTRQTKTTEIQLRLKLLSPWVEPLSPTLKDALHNFSAEYGVAVMLVYADGRAFIAPDGYALSDAQATRLKAALQNALTAQTIRDFQTNELSILTQRVMAGDQIQAILAVAVPPTNLEAGTNRLLNTMRDAALVGGLIALILALLIARSLARPVTRLIAAADRMARGVYDDPPLPASQDELGRLTRAFNSMREQVQRARQSERHFLSGVSHDLKTPVAIVQGYVGALLDGTAADEASRQRALSGIQREADRMNALIASLLELARLEAGLTPFAPVAVDVRALARKTLDAFAPQANAKNVMLNDDLPATLPPLQADPTLLERVLANLLDNAIRFTPPGGAIALGGAAESDGVLRLWVHDTGSGIPPDALPHIFDRFFQVDPARSSERRGSGLGLAIAREIVQHHGGAINAESQVGQGTRFIVTLPLSLDR